MKVTADNIMEMLDDLKTMIHPSLVIDKHEVTPYDFYYFLDNNLKYRDMFMEISNYNRKYLENVIEQKAFSDDTYSKAILSEFIKVNNKDKFLSSKKEDGEVNVQAMSDDELNKTLTDLLKKSR